MSETATQEVGTIVDDDAPILATEENSQRAIALDSVTFVRDPFSVTNLNYFGTDRRTRIIVFSTNLSLTPDIVVNARIREALVAGCRSACGRFYCGRVDRQYKKAKLRKKGITTKGEANPELRRMMGRKDRSSSYR